MRYSYMKACLSYDKKFAYVSHVIAGTESLYCYTKTFDDAVKFARIYNKQHAVKK